MRWLPLLLLVMATTSCHARDEARNVIAAVDAYRVATNDDKPAKADALDKVECTVDEVCAVKTACTKSADATARGLRAQQEIQAAAASHTGDRDQLADKWHQAGVDLDEGFARLEECRNKTAALKERFGL
jgi:hypothetical protein